MATVLQKDIPNWANLGGHLWRTFTNRRDLYQQWKGGGDDWNNDDANRLPDFMKFFVQTPQQMEWSAQQKANQGIQERVSLNELFIALICCSRGTLGDKVVVFSFLWAR